MKRVLQSRSRYLFRDILGFVKDRVHGKMWAKSKREPFESFLESSNFPRLRLLSNMFRAGTCKATKPRALLQ